MPSAMRVTLELMHQLHHARFKEYFDGTQEAVAILLSAVKRVGPITIEELRSIRERFHPPQVLLRLTNTETKALQRLAKK